MITIDDDNDDDDDHADDGYFYYTEGNLRSYLFRFIGGLRP